MDEPVYYKGTEGYDRKVKTFTLSPDQAAQKIVDYEAAQRAQAHLPQARSAYVGMHLVIIGNYYLFSEKNKMGIPVSGWYVNAMSGEVSRRDTDGLLPFRHEAK